MTLETWLVLLLPGSSLITGVLIFLTPEERSGIRTTLNLAGAIAKLLLVAAIVHERYQGRQFEARFPVLPEQDLVLRVDFLALLFVSLSAILWLLTTIYAIGYLEHSAHRTRFFGFFSLCVTATMGIALAGNLLTFIIFYEMLTVVTYPLVVHRGTGSSLAAGRTYLLYTLFGGLLLLLGGVWAVSLAGAADFRAGGVMSDLLPAHRGELLVIFWLLIGGLGVKAALVPFHGWLPQAMIAPAPVSALLHAVAVVKAGAYGIVRVVHYVFGVDAMAALGVALPLAILAAVTIVFGSLRALTQDDLKKRLAYSTVSQLSYITLGVAMLGPISATGGIVHLIHQGILKITLFLCAGVITELLHVRKVSELGGVGRRLPLTMAAFTLGAFGMIGVPPTAGFFSKWYLGVGGLNEGHPWVVAVLVVSSALNAVYFLPIIRIAYFGKGPRRWEGDPGPSRGLEGPWMLVVPPVTTALLALAAGVFAGLWFSPLGLASMAALELYPP